MGPLIFDYRHIFGDRIAWGVSLEPARTRRLPPSLGGLTSGFAFFQFGVMASR